MFLPVYKVTSPQVIEEFVEHLEYDEKSVLVHVDKMAICKADIRYYLGKRDQHVLERKYPLAPIHEAVGHVIKDPTGTYKKGDKVILIPNSIDPNRCLTCPFTRCKEEEFGENYCPYAQFRSSTCDGFMREIYSCRPDQLVKYDDSIEDAIAVFSELLSVSHAACRRIHLGKVRRVALFGDGIMGYMVYILLVRKYRLDVTLFGMDGEKMKMFKEAEKTKYADYRGEKFDTLLECVGGNASAFAINQMIDLAAIGADLILMGVAEDNIAVNTRKILEKGLSLKGVTRSSPEDFRQVAALLNREDVREDLKPLVLSVHKITSVNDVYANFEREIENTRIIGKNLMEF